LRTDAVLIPIKGFSQAKKRLGTSMTDDVRLKLVRSMADRVVASCAPLPVFVVCDDQEVADWATSQGATVIWEPGRGLNGAVQSGLAQLEEAGLQWVTVAHGDLPYAMGIGTLAPFDGITLIPDRVDDGTNVMRLPVGCGFSFSYGPRSFHAHLAEAFRIGLPVRVHRTPALAYDVDWPADVVGLTTP
jgi:2-phospho-L-lactate guanylyltransferase